jgi:hypothetical protein
VEVVAVGPDRTTLFATDAAQERVVVVRRVLRPTLGKFLGQNHCCVEAS